MSSIQISRRGFLRTLAASSAGWPLLVAACAPPAPPVASQPPTTTLTATQPSAVLYPNYYAAALPTGVKADYHDADPRYEDGFENYPANPFKSWNRQPP